MGCELDRLMWEAWVRVKDRVLGDEAELRRRLARREKVYERVPRALCIAIRASDRRITEVHALIRPQYAIAKGCEAEHEVQITSELMRDLCRPVEMEWLTEFADVSRKLGNYRGRCRRLECQGLVKGHRIPLLGGKKGKPVPVVTSGVPAMSGSLQGRELLVLDPCAKRNATAHELLLPYWRELGARLPDGIEQILVRKPALRVLRGRQQMCGWRWLCPGCGEQARTIYFPMGSPDWARAHGITLPAAWYEAPRPRECFACYRCHHLLNLSRSTEQKLCDSWNEMIGHMSGGLLYGREVERPASFGIKRHGKSFSVRRPSPRRDEMESYLANTDLPIPEIARRMELQLQSVSPVLSKICKLRGVKGREELMGWWAKKRLADRPAVTAA